MEQKLVVPIDADPLNKYEENQAQTKRLIIDGVKDHVIPHIASKNTANAMWTALEVMYQGGYVQRRMLLENQMQMFQMMKGEEIDPFLFRLQAIRDQLIDMGANPDEGLLVRTTLNVVSEEWKRLSKALSEGQRYHHGQICGLFSAKRRSGGSPRNSLSVEEADQPE